MEGSQLHARLHIGSSPVAAKPGLGFNFGEGGGLFFSAEDKKLLNQSFSVPGISLTERGVENQKISCRSSVNRRMQKPYTIIEV
mmetsp:Transcript_39982/g.159067  ORF Transcript_39982/g.159067 Transcript_39982/m.159067 type:complete len:84 (-) Transcript_39982:971-1222(-)